MPHPAAAGSSPVPDPPNPLPSNHSPRGCVISQVARSGHGNQPDASSIRCQLRWRLPGICGSFVPVSSFSQDYECSGTICNLHLECIYVQGTGYTHTPRVMSTSQLLTINYSYAPLKRAAAIIIIIPRGPLGPAQ